MIEIDECHRHLIEGIILSIKPKSVLELGYGTGKTTKSILYALNYNGFGTLSVVENFRDWNGNKPDHFIPKRFKHIYLDESEYLTSSTDVYDVIIADGDHYNTHKFWEKLVNMLTSKGCLIVHDVCNKDFPNLNVFTQLPGALVFNTSSRIDEKCERGLAILFKS